MSCCNGKCGCGSSCKCGDGCNGCGKYPDLSDTEYYSTSENFVVGVSPTKLEFEESEMGVAGENGCKCNPCTCDPCTCK